MQRWALNFPSNKGQQKWSFSLNAKGRWGYKPTRCLNLSKKVLRDEIPCDGQVMTLKARRKVTEEPPQHCSLGTVTSSESTRLMLKAPALCLVTLCCSRDAPTPPVQPPGRREEGNKPWFPHNVRWFSDQQEKKKKKALKCIPWEKAKWGFAGWVKGFANPGFREITQKPHAAPEKVLRRLLKKSHFNLLI